MCTLAAYFRVSPTLPLVIAANRDEFHDRPTLAPGVIAHDPDVVAGLDLQAGGTWLGTNEHGLSVGVLNRRNPDGPDPTRRSRGLLCLELLQTRGPDEAEALLRTRDASDYNWFNLLVADRDRAFVAGNRQGAMAVRRLEPGLHVLTNLDLNDFTCPRIAKSYARFQAVELSVAPAAVPALAETLRAILSDHELPLDPRLADPLNTLCIHTRGYGTRSSTLIFHHASGRVDYLHADGPPCQAPYKAVALPWAP